LIGCSVFFISFMKRDFTILIIFTVLSLCGMLALFKLPLTVADAGPGEELRVTFKWPNATPRILESQVTAPLEGLISTLQGVRRVQSGSGYHGGFISIIKEESKSAEQLRFEVTALIRQVYRNLPMGVSYPTVTVGSGDQENGSSVFLILYVSGDGSTRETRTYTEQILKPAIAKSFDVHSIEIYGGEREEMVLEYRPDVLASLNLVEEDLVSSLTKQTQQVNLGFMRNFQGERENVSIMPEKSPKEVESLTIGKLGERTLLLGDIVRSTRIDQKPTSYLRINGRDVIQVVLRADRGSSQISVARGVREFLEHLPRVSGKYTIHVGFDASEELLAQSSRVISQILIAFGTVLLLAFIFFRSWKAMVVTSAGLASILLISALIFYVFKIRIPASVIPALSILIGSLSSYLWLTHDHLLRKKSKMIVITLGGATLIMIAVFSATRFLPTDLRDELLDLAMVLIVPQVVSLFTCYWLVGAIISQLGDTERQAIKSPFNFTVRLGVAYKYVLATCIRYKISFFFILLLFFGFPFFLFPHQIGPGLTVNNRFILAYNSFVGNSWFDKNIRPSLDVGFGGSLRLFVNHVFDNAYYASDKKTAIHIKLGMPNKSTASQMNSALRSIEADLSKYPQIDRFVSRVDNGQEGGIIVYFKKPYDKGSFPFRLKAAIVSKSTQMSGIDWDIYGVGEGFSFNVNDNGIPTFNILLKGYDYDVLENISENLRTRLLANSRASNADINKVPGVSGQKELVTFKAHADQASLAGHGISPSQLYEAIMTRSVVPGPDFYWLDGHEYLAINMRPHQNSGFDLAAAQSEPFKIMKSSTLKLGGLLSVAKVKVTPMIMKEDQQYLRMVSFDYTSSFNFGEKFMDKVLDEFQSEMPMGYSAEKQLSGRWNIQSGYQYKMLLLSLLLIMILGMIMFESVRQPIALILGVCFSFTGLFLAFYMTSFTFDRGGYASFYLLAGMVPLPMMIVINQYNTLVTIQQLRSIEVYKRSVRQTLRSILYFATGSIAGLLPFLTQSSHEPFWSSMALGTIGGIIVSCFVILFVLPPILLSRHSRTAKAVFK
jgi:multidrug efflux pump subunit AcrB